MPALIFVPCRLLPSGSASQPLLPLGFAAYGGCHRGYSRLFTPTCKTLRTEGCSHCLHQLKQSCSFTSPNSRFPSMDGGGACSFWWVLGPKERQRKWGEDVKGSEATSSNPVRSSTSSKARATSPEKPGQACSPGLFFHSPAMRLGQLVSPQVLCTREEDTRSPQDSFHSRPGRTT